MNFKYIFFYSNLAGLATILGTFVLLRKEEWSKKNAHYLISFAAGSMLAVSFAHLIPEATELYKSASLWVLGGILLFYIIQHIINIHPCHDEHCTAHGLRVISIIGLTFHSVLDGVAIAVGFEVNLGIGIFTTLAVILHEFPEGITVTSILLYANIKRQKVIIYSILVAIATPIGAIVSYFVIKHISGELLGILLALAAGSFIYIAVADLIPETHKSRDIKNLFVFLGGIFALLLIGMFLG